jgi:hypothetical protein
MLPSTSFSDRVDQQEKLNQLALNARQTHETNDRMLFSWPEIRKGLTVGTPFKCNATNAATAISTVDWLIDSYTAGHIATSQRTEVL